MPTELLPQPPPGVPAPPGKVAKRSKQRLMNLLAIGFVAMFPFGCFTLGRLAEFGFVSNRGVANRITADANAKQIGQALLEFDNQYGKYPDATTAAMVKAKTGSTWMLGDATSNDLFQQFMVSGIVISEDLFYAKSPWTKKADNIFTSESQALAAGECGFAYITGLSSKDDPDTPICVTPLEPGKLTSDRESFDGKAIILRLDNSVIQLPIDPSGQVILNGMDLFDPRQPFWHGKAPNVKWPK